MRQINKMCLDFEAVAENEAFARLTVSGFILPLDPTVDELADVRTAVSEAVTNAIVHGYAGRRGTVRLRAGYDEDGTLRLEVVDRGCGIADVRQARQPFFTTASDGEERSGMGFTVMESFMDELDVFSELGRGTTVRMAKHIHPRDEALPRRA